MRRAKVFARFHRVDGTAIRALGHARARHVQVNLRMAVPDFHVRLRTRAKNTALVVEVCSQ